MTHTFLRLLRSILFAFAFIATPGHAQPLPPTSDAPYAGTLSLAVDATDLDRKLFRVRQTMPVRPGPLVLLYPRWMPGTHSPRGNVAQLAGLHISAAGRPIAWKRNTVEVQAFHLDVPAGVASLDIEFDVLTPVDGETGRVVATSEILGLQWNAAILYPAGHAATGIQVAARLTLPEGWQFGTALEVDSRRGATVSFRPVDLDTLVDSPVFAGRYFKRVDLDSGAQAAGRAPVFLNIVADRESQLAATPEQLALHAALVTQADQLFGARHFAHYDFLFALTDSFGRIGLEHHQSSENAVAPGYFTEWTKTSRGRDLLPHEYVHSWNGKFRRPADMWTPHFNTPMQGSLLWMYEGQTQFWGHVLAARSGLMSRSDALADLAMTAASYAARQGRAWRNLQDTTTEPIVSMRSNLPWRSWQRGEDYYDEMRLVWTEADMLIRELSGDQRSLDDFARAFFGVQPGRVQPLTYTFDDVVAELNRVQPMDWAGFLRQRLDTNDGGGLLEGLRRGGWQLSFTDTPTAYFKGAEGRGRGGAEFAYSIGIDVGERNRITQVVWGSPAFAAGLTTAATLLAVNGREYKADLLREAITAAKGNGPKVELLVKTGDRYRSVTLDYRDGLRFPRLTRIPDTPDRLGALLTPK